MLAAYPVLSQPAEWVVRVDGPRKSYSPVEGVVGGEAASGHPLEWFAPRFGLEAPHWRTPGLARVASAALGLEVSRFGAEPMVITEGPAVELGREQLRKAGKPSEAERADLSVEFRMEGMRTLFTWEEGDDHHEFVGLVRAVQPIRPRPELDGLRLEVECLPDQLASGHRLPLYVFAPALEQGFLPKPGDLVCGIAWLQGTCRGAASPADVAAWQQAGGDLEPAE